MARAAERLSDRHCRTAKAAVRPLMLPDGKGLYLRIGTTGSKSWIYRYRDDGQRHDLGLGPYPETTLAEARDKALAHRRARLTGTDPLAAKRSNRVAKLPAMTFAEAAERYFEGNKAGWSARHAKLWLSGMQQHAFPVLGRLPVGEVDLPAVLHVIEPMWHDKTETASRLRARIEAVLDWATVRGHRSGDNPAVWKGRLEAVLPSPKRIKTVERFAALPYREMPALMVELHAQGGAAYRALELLVLTATRTGDVLNARWDEIDLAEKLWTIPAGRAKSRREHRIPLSEAAVSVIETMRAASVGEFVFRGLDGATGHNSLRQALQRVRPGINPHGFRSSFRDWAAEQTAYPEVVAEMALGHQVGSAVERAYRRSDLFERRARLMDDWARFCAEPVAGGENVVAIRA